MDANTLDATKRIQPREITQEMQEAYLDYAMSVIVSRALPDVRDGLKPVHRRILYVMHENGLRHNVKFRKCATVVGDVLGKYHPHNDVAVYDALARMVQEFSLRYPLVDGQGNFGSIDGDAPAAYRYTECRLESIAEEMLSDIDKDTVNWVPNYDGTREEPTVLPSRVPNLLLNGSVGIAVGMATNIPPHNLVEVMDALIHLAENPKATSEDLMQFIKGPDFPTGGAIYGKKDITQAYASGRGPMVVRGVADIAELKGSKGFQIIIKEIPYQVNKATMLEHLAELVKDKKIEGIKDIRDESDKDGIRVVIELRNDAYPQKVLNKLYKLTDLQKTFHLNMLALADGIQPQVLPLKSVLEHYLAHRRVVVERRTRFELKKAEERKHILEGLSRALDHIDAVIDTIRKSETREEAHGNLMKKFKLSEVQASAILEMRLATLAGLERKKIEDELAEKKKLIAYYNELLGDPKKLLGVVKAEFKEIKEKYPSERRTKIYAGAVGEFTEEDLIPDEEVIITLSRDGFIKRLAPGTYRTQKRGGSGKIGASVAEEDFIQNLAVASTHDSILFFTSTGKVFLAKVHEIPVATRTSKGRALVNFLEIGPEEAITAIVPVKFDIKKSTSGSKNSPQANGAAAKYLVMITRNGIIKKTEVVDFANVRRSGLVAIKLKGKNGAKGEKGGDELGWVKLTSGKDEIILVTKNGQAIRFSENDVRDMGRAAAGVNAIRLKGEKGDEEKGGERGEKGERGGDAVAGADVIGSQQKDAEMLVVLAKGYAKRTPIKLYKKQKRAGSGIKTAKVTAKTGEIVSAKILNPEEEDLIVISKKGQLIRTPLKDVSVLGRATQGVRVMRPKDGDQIASITTL
ncbi:MAG: DNA gyrase subunit A [Parcubacteria group bacterium]|nr:DNA gyrase subunit A [Parcubacteria group bacterium]